MKDKRISKNERPSTYIASALNKVNKDTVDYFVKTFGISKADANDIIHNNLTYHQLLNILKKKLDMEMATEIIPKIQQAVNDKLEKGSLEQAQRGMTALAIARDKVFGDNKEQRINIGGKNVQINLDWQFKPYKAGKTKKLKG